MDLRALKKKCKAAVDALVRDHGYRRDAFSPADGSETFDAPSGLEPRFVSNGWIEPGVLKGTLVYWYRCSYEYDEWNCKLPCEMLAEIEHWASMTDDDMRLMLAATNPNS